MIVQYWSKELGRDILARYIQVSYNQIYEVTDINYKGNHYVFTTTEGLEISENEVIALGIAKGTLEKIK